MSDKAVSRILHEAERELDAAKRETCSPAVERLIDCLEKIIEVLQISRDRSLMDSYADLKAQKDAMLARESDARQKEIDEAVAGAYRAAADLPAKWRRYREGWCAGEDVRQAFAKAADELDAALTPASAQKAFADAVAAEVEIVREAAVQARDIQKGLADSFRKERDILQQQLTRLTEEKERLRVQAEMDADMLLSALQERCPCCRWPLAESMEKGCVAGNCSYRPGEHSPEYDAWLARAHRSRELLLAQAALTPAAGGETRGK